MTIKQIIASFDRAIAIRTKNLDNLDDTLPAWTERQAEENEIELLKSFRDSIVFGKESKP